MTKFKSILLSTFLMFAVQAQSQNITIINQSNQSIDPQLSDLFEIINGVPVSKKNKMAMSVVDLMQLVPLSFGIDEAWMSICTGSVIGDKYILTAAHCVNGNEATTYAVNFSAQTVDNDKQADLSTRIVDVEKVFQVRRVKAFKVHPNYDRSGRADLAVLLLEKKIPSGAKPVKLMPDSWLNLEEKKTAWEGHSVTVTLMGFGIISESPRIGTEVLRMTTVPARFEGNYVITDQTGGSGGCNGDSGGPAFLTYKGQTYQVGVTHGPNEGSTTCHEEGQWVNPALDKAFISDAMKTLK